MKQKIRIIVNPVSGSGRRKKALKMIDKYLDREKFEFDLVKTEYHRHAVELTQLAVNDGCKAVVIAGGDGSINEVGATLAGTGVALGIIPAGSGNGLSRSLGIPLNPKKAVENINNIIDIIQADNPNVTIFIEQMAPGRFDFMTPELTSYINQLQQEVLSIASDQSTSTSQVIAVDMFTGFNDSLLADDIHYNEAGAEFIATRYYNVLINVLEQ